VDEPNPGQLALGPEPIPLGEQLGVFGAIEHRLEVGAVVAGVDGEAHRRHRRRERLVGDEVLHPHRRRIHPDLTGVGVHDPLEVVDRLGTAGAAVGVGGHGVGVHAVELQRVGNLYWPDATNTPRKGMATEKFWL
jgi:hypothetical protein